MLTQQQLDELAKTLHSPIAKILREPPAEVTVKLSLSLVDETQPEGPSRLRVDVRVRGREVSPEREEQVRRLFSAR